MAYKTNRNLKRKKSLTELAIKISVISCLKSFGTINYENAWGRQEQSKCQKRKKIIDLLCHLKAEKQFCWEEICINNIRLFKCLCSTLPHFVSSFCAVLLPLLSVPLLYLQTEVFQTLRSWLVDLALHFHVLVPPCATTNCLVLTEETVNRICTETTVIAYMWINLNIWYWLP